MSGQRKEVQVTSMIRFNLFVYVGQKSTNKFIEMLSRQSYSSNERSIRCDICAVEVEEFRDCVAKTARLTLNLRKLFVISFSIHRNVFVFMKIAVRWKRNGLRGISFFHLSHSGPFYTLKVAWRIGLFEIMVIKFLRDDCLYGTKQNVPRNNC